jgi:hypothetical protein
MYRQRIWEQQVPLLIGLLNFGIQTPSLKYICIISVEYSNEDRRNFMYNTTQLFIIKVNISRPKALSDFLYIKI